MNLLKTAKNFPCVITVLCIIFSAFVPNVWGRSFDEIKKSKELRICLVLFDGYTEVYPSGCKNDCNYSGWVYDLAIAFAKQNKLNPKISIMEWDEQFHNDKDKTDREAVYTPKHLQSGRCDLYPNNLTRLPWREKKLHFESLYPSRMFVIINKKNKQKFKKPSDLVGGSMAITENTSYHTWMLNANKDIFKAKPVTIQLAGPQDDYKLVDEGKVDFTLRDSDLAIYLIKNKAKNSMTAFSMGETDDIGWGMRHEDKDLHKAVKDFIDEGRRNKRSTLNEVLQKYLGLTLSEFTTIVTAK
ncbi:MAG: transporter substrate-binding domain-containing protein [Oligoflexales bacterium]|nr:transporter substrate-binding domain-containing protein [Oligoflexales bacterium]